MKNILVDLAIAISDINEFYYSVSEADCEDDILCVDNDEVRIYERRFVAEMKSKFEIVILINILTLNCLRL